MSSSVSSEVGGVVVITHVHPITPGAQFPQVVGTQQGYEGRKFSIGRPLALGTLQILIGTMVLLFGITMAINADTLGIYSGIFVWGPLFYITSGSLTVAAGKSLNRCLVTGSLVVNIITAVASCTAVILYSLDAAGILLYRCYDSNPSGYWPAVCYLYTSRMQGFSGVLAIFNLLELIVSATVAGFACNAGCCCNKQTVTYIQNPGEPKATNVIEPPSYATVIN